MGVEFSQQEEAYPRTVCWIDDNHLPNNITIIKFLREKNIKVETFSTTEEFKTFYENHKLNEAPFSELRIITDMNRVENNVQKKTAGLDVLNFLRSNQYQHPILIYQSEKHVPRTVTYLREKKISWVFAESSLVQTKEFAMFSPQYTPSYPIQEAEGRPLEQIRPPRDAKTEKSINRADYDRIKREFQDEVKEISDYMVKDQIQHFKIPPVDFDTLQKLPEKHKGWHTLLVSELMKHKFFKFGNYSLALSFFETCKTLPPYLPIYCAVAVRLYSGPNLYRDYLEDLKQGNFNNWKIFTAVLETAFYFLEPWKGVVWRGTNSRSISPFYHEQMKCSDFVYVIIGVTSTSVEKRVADKFIDPMKPNPTLYKLYTRNGRDISPLSEYKSEKEILLPIFSAWVVVQTGWIDVEKNNNKIKTRFVQAVQIDTPMIDNEDADTDIDMDIEKLIEEGKELLRD